MPAAADALLVFTGDKLFMGVFEITGNSCPLDDKINAVGGSCGCVELKTSEVFAFGDVEFTFMLLAIDELV